MKGKVFSIELNREKLKNAKPTSPQFLNVAMSLIEPI